MTFLRNRPPGSSGCVFAVAMMVCASVTQAQLPVSDSLGTVFRLLEGGRFVPGTSGGIQYIRESRTTIVTGEGIITMSQGMRSDVHLRHPWNGNDPKNPAELAKVDQNCMSHWNDFIDQLNSIPQPESPIRDICACPNKHRYHKSGIRCLNERELSLRNRFRIPPA